jgi:hypothetical protein
MHVNKIQQMINDDFENIQSKVIIESTREQIKSSELEIKKKKNIQS